MIVISGQRYTDRNIFAWATLLFVWCRILKANSRRATKSQKISTLGYVQDHGGHPGATPSGLVR
jgi:hypothetical protein